jgi:hypothetical protein
MQYLRKISDRNLPAICSICRLPAIRIQSNRFASLHLGKGELSNENNKPSELIVNRNPSAYNGNRPSAVIDVSNVKNAKMENVTFENVHRAIYGENMDLKVKNMLFVNVKVGIEHINSTIEAENIRSENS